MSALLREGFTVTAKRVRPIRRHVETANERGGYLREINLAPDSRFVKVRVYHKPGHHVSRIDVWWQDGGGNVFKQRIGRGEDSHASVEIKLPDDVAITRIEGYAGDNIIETIRVRTSDGQDTGMLGEDDVRNLRHFVINVPQASEATGLYFRSGKFVNAVGVEWDDPTSR